MHPDPNAQPCPTGCGGTMTPVDGVAPIPQYYPGPDDDLTVLRWHPTANLDGGWAVTADAMLDGKPIVYLVQLDHRTARHIADLQNAHLGAPS